MSHRAGRLRLVSAAVAAVAGTLSLIATTSSLRAQSQDTTGHNGWGIVYSSPRSRQSAQKVTTASATSQAPAAAAPTNAPPPAPVPQNNPPANNASTTGTAAAGWANGAAPAANAPSAPAPAPAPSYSGAVTNRGYAGDPPPVSNYNANTAPPANGAVYGGGAATSGGYAGDPPAAAAPAAPASTGNYGSARVPGVIYSSNGGVYPPPATRYAAPAPAAQAAAPQAPAPTNGAYAGNGYAPNNSYYVGGNTTMPAERPTNLPPNGRTDASYDIDTVPPPPAGAQAAVSTSSIHLDELMSLHEWESSGVSRLRPQEIAVLEKWIERYRAQVADSVTRTLQTTPRGPAAAAAAPLAPISRTADGTPKNAHAVVAIRSGSRYITLDDGSVWDVYQSDQTETSAWQQGDLVQVRVAPVAYGEFDHELVNNQRTGPVRAKFMGYAAKQ
jgi:hypothetical protein